jgi:hypothetical protein
MRFVVFKIGEAICTMHSVKMIHNVEEQTMTSSDASENRASRQTGHEQTAIGVRKALRHSVTARNQAHKSKSIDGRTDWRKNHLIII